MKVPPLTALKGLMRKTDFKSIGEMVQFHAKLLNHKQCKYVRTSDPQTLQIAHRILEKNEFLKRHILGIPNQSILQTESIPVTISHIKKYPSLQAQYSLWKSKNKNRVIGIGGPSASDQTLIASMIPQIRNKAEIHFYCKDYLQSNILHSASQSHARHGNALNADQVLSGRHLLYFMIKRKIFPPNLSQVISSDYIKVDVKAKKTDYLKVYVKNQFNGILQILKSKCGMLNEHDLNRLQSIASQQIQKIMEQSSGIIFRSNKDSAQKEKSMAIHVIFTKKSLQQIKDEQSHYSEVKQIKWDQLTKLQIEKYIPHSQGLITAFRYHGDYSNRFDMYQTCKMKSIQLGATWKEEKVLSRVFVDFNDSQTPFVCGILFKDGQFVPANKVHLSLGYKAKYIYEDSLVSPVKNIVVPATGVSLTIILKKTTQLKQIIKQKGKAMEIAIVNSHWAIIEQDQDYILMRATAGGNTGSQQYMPSYFINLCANTRRIFGQAFVGIVSAYGCSRAVNFKNSTEFADVAQGLVISYGKGGTGNTKRSSEAYKSLKYLGFQKQLESFFKLFEIDRLNIAQTMERVCKESEKVNFYYKNYDLTLKILRHQ